MLEGSGTPEEPARSRANRLETAMTGREAMTIEPMQYIGKTYRFHSCARAERGSPLSPIISLEVSMSSPCKHDTLLPAFLHAGGDVQLSFEGRPFNVEAGVCSECGLIQLRVRHPQLFTAYLAERDGRKR